MPIYTVEFDELLHCRMYFDSIEEAESFFKAPDKDFHLYQERVVVTMSRLLNVERKYPTPD